MDRLVISECPPSETLTVVEINDTDEGLNSFDTTETITKIYFIIFPEIW